MNRIPETNEILHTGLEAGKPFLGTPSVMEAVIRKYMHDLTALRVAQVKNGDDLVDGLMALGNKFQSIVYGHDPRYLAGSFYQEAQLGKYLVEACDMGGEVIDAGFRAGIRMARDFFNILAEHEDDTTDAPEAQTQIDELVKLWVRILSGRPGQGPAPTEEMAKSYVAGYTRADGVYVKPHYTSVFKQAPKKPLHHHPKAGDKGEKVAVKAPTAPSAPASWHNGKETATFVPEGDFPHSINDISFVKWATPPATKKGWNFVPGINRELKEKPFTVAEGKHPAAGVIVEEADGRVWLVTPTNAFGGYQNSFPKGTCEEGLSMQANAIKEAWEESGLQVEITGVLGDFERTTSTARMYIAKRIGGNPVDMGWESQAVRLVPKEQLFDFLNMDTDKEIVEAYLRRKKG